MSKRTLKTIEEIAAAIIEQNPEFAQELVDNDGSNYRIAEAKVKPLMREVGRLTGKFVRTHDMVWACINAATGSDQGPSLKLSL